MDIKFANDNSNVYSFVDIRPVGEWVCNCGSKAFRVETVKNRPPEIICVYCGAVHHMDDIMRTPFDRK